MTDQHAPEPLIGEDAVPPPAHEPVDRPPASRADSVGTSPEHTFGETVDGRPLGTASTVPSRGRSNVRWILALVGVLVVAVGTYLVVSLAGGRPSQSVALGYMPPTVYTYVEARLDLPGDQRQKLAGFLAAFPGFKDQSQVEVKLDDVFDRIVRAASNGKQTWTADIKPWFGGQVAFGAGLPSAASLLGGAMNPAMGGMAGMDNALFVVSITDRAKASAWITALDPASINRTTYGNADYFDNADRPADFAVAVTDKVMLGGSAAAVKAAVDSNGNTAFAQDADVKAALAAVDKDYVLLSVVRTRAYLTELVKTAAALQPGILDQTRIDDTIVAMFPPWQVSTARFENDALVAGTTGEPFAIGFDAQNRTSGLVGHVPARTIVYLDYHDVGPALKALTDKFRALPETKPAFDQVDRTLAILGGFDAIVSWWGDTAIVISPLADGTIGGGLVIKPRDAAAAERLLTTINSFVAFGGGQAGITSRTEDHNGTKVTILDVSRAVGMTPQGLPPGYKAEIAWATNADVTVIGYGQAFVNAVLDAGPGNSLGDDARFKALLNRVGAENISLGYIDVAGIRGLVEPLLERMAPPAEWTNYSTEIKPYLDHLDALMGTNRKDGALDRGSAIITVR